jgi:hypothetical protein
MYQYIVHRTYPLKQTACTLRMCNRDCLSRTGFHQLWNCSHPTTHDSVLVYLFPVTSDRNEFISITRTASQCIHACKHTDIQHMEEINHPYCTPSAFARDPQQRTQPCRELTEPNKKQSTNHCSKSRIWKIEFGSIHFCLEIISDTSLWSVNQSDFI